MDFKFGEKQFDVSRIKKIHINNKNNCWLLYIAGNKSEFQ
jgi:hypothetical protein